MLFFKTVSTMLFIIGATASLQIVGYSSTSAVDEHSYIDLDLKSLLDTTAVQNWTGALNVYLNGENSHKSSSMRTLAKFSTDAAGKMAAQPMFNKYFSYYDAQPDFTGAKYAHEWVVHAINGTGPFAGASDVARKELANKGAAYMSVWMYVIHEMEDAIGDCRRGEIEDNDAGVKAWDEAIAFYAGSLEGGTTGGSTSGTSVYRLAEKRCQNFATCGEAGKLSGSGISSVNQRMLAQFTEGQALIATGQKHDCNMLQVAKEKITQLMTIPLIQGALRYAWKCFQSTNAASSWNKSVAEGAVFSAAVLPQIYACDASAATLIARNQDWSSINNVSFPTMNDGFASVLAAYESVYSCLGVTCADIGQLEEAGGDHTPCNDPIAGYTPDTNVDEHKQIDYDQKKFEEELAESDWTEAEAVYTNGAYSAKSSSMRTLKGFSTAAGTKMKDEELFIVYKNYYGSATYADDYIMSAIKGTGDFIGADNIARVEGAKKGSAYLSVWMYVIHEMEDAVNDCKSNNMNDNDNAVHAWDEAVGFYTGELEGLDGTQSGKLLYALAGKRCANFNTCKKGTRGEAIVNEKVFYNFEAGRRALINGDCNSVHDIISEIKTQMLIPLIQGTLRYIYLADPSGGNKAPLAKQQAEGWTFAMAILPQVALCDKTVADAIVKNMKFGTNLYMADGYKSITAKLESVYACLGVSGIMVGGLVETIVDSNTHAVVYVDGMRPLVPSQTGLLLPSSLALKSGKLSSSSAPPACDDTIDVTVAAVLMVVLILVGIALGFFVATLLNKSRASAPVANSKAHYKNLKLQDNEQMNLKSEDQDSAAPIATSEGV